VHAKNLKIPHFGKGSGVRLQAAAHHFVVGLNAPADRGKEAREESCQVRAVNQAQGRIASNSPFALVGSFTSENGGHRKLMEVIFSERSGTLSLTYLKARRSRASHIRCSCKPFRDKASRERLSEHLMKLFIDGEKDEHRLTVEGLSYLRALDREIDSRN
jgi:hypothetical protein